MTIALAIALLLAALSMPPLDRWLSDGRFREACGRFEAGLEQCRAESLRRGAAVAAVCRSRRDGSWVVVSRVMEESREPTTGAGPSAGPLAAASAGAAADQPASVGTMTGRTVVTLGRGITFTRVAAASLEAGAEEKSAGPNSEMMLAVFFPDGSAAGEPGLTIRDGRGRAMEVRVNGWTGSVSMVKAAAESSGADRAAEGPSTDERPPREPATGRTP